MGRNIRCTPFSAEELRIAFEETWNAEYLANYLTASAAVYTICEDEYVDRHFLDDYKTTTHLLFKRHCHVASDNIFSRPAMDDRSRTWSTRPTNLPTQKMRSNKNFKEDTLGL